MNSLVEIAKAIAEEAHRGQTRRDGKRPYIVHPEAVADRVGHSDECVAAAWLHDVLEDSSLTSDDLRQRGVPDPVIVAVEILTRDESMAYEDYLQRVAENPIARRVKVADMLANLSDTPTRRQIRKYAKGLLRLVPENDESQ